jgi:hypothetical protein
MILKYIEKQLKLRTIRTLREKHLTFWTCIAVKSIPFAMVSWYIKQVMNFADDNFVNCAAPFHELKVKRKTHVWEERLIFLDWLEQEVIAGRK